MTGIRNSALVEGFRQLWALVRASSRVPPACQPKHRSVVQARAAALCRVLAVLTLLWVPIDALWLGDLHADSLLVLRLCVAAGLFGLARIAPRLPVPVVVHSFVWWQAIGFGLIQLQVEPVRDSALQIGYGLFPYLLAAQLALFALPWWRTLLAGLAPAMQLAVVLRTHPPSGAQAWNSLWLLGLIIAIAAWTSQAQLRLLVDLLDARRDALHDALTGLANRRYAGERIEAARAHAIRHGESLSLLMLDIDHFKQVNDRWGHANGDRVLAELANVLRDSLRAGDMAARVGGEEFLVLLPGDDLEQARDAAERIRARVAALRIALPGEMIATTVSIGIATLTAAESVGQLLGRGDIALYAAKRAGRNRCLAWEPGLEASDTSRAAESR